MEDKSILKFLKTPAVKAEVEEADVTVGNEEVKEVTEEEIAEIGKEVSKNVAAAALAVATNQLLKAKAEKAAIVPIPKEQVADVEEKTKELIN